MLPEEWDCSKHDKLLLSYVSERGFDSLISITEKVPELADMIDLNQELATRRIEEVCEFYKDF